MKYKCSKCGKKGHNKQSCKKKVLRRKKKTARKKKTSRKKKTARKKKASRKKKVSKKKTKRKAKKKKKAKKPSVASGCIHEKHCHLCGKEVQFLICRVKNCFLPGRHYAMWETTPAKWRKLSTKLRNKVLCKKCFRKEAGVAPGPQYWG